MRDRFSNKSNMKQRNASYYFVLLHEIQQNTLLLSNIKEKHLFITQQCIYFITIEKGTKQLLLLQIIDLLEEGN